MVLVDVDGVITAASEISKGTTASGNEWMRRRFLVKTMDKAPTTLDVSIGGDALKEFDNLIDVGNKVTITVSVFSRSWRDNKGTEHWSNNIDCVYMRAYEENPSGEAKMAGVVAGIAVGMKAK